MKPDEETGTKAAVGGHWEVLQWAISHGCLWDVKQICKDAARWRC